MKLLLNHNRRRSHSQWGALIDDDDVQARFNDPFRDKLLTFLSMWVAKLNMVRKTVVPGVNFPHERTTLRRKILFMFLFPNKMRECRVKGAKKFVREEKEKFVLYNID